MVHGQPKYLPAVYLFLTIAHNRISTDQSSNISVVIFNFCFLNFKKTMHNGK